MVATPRSNIIQEIWIFTRTTQKCIGCVAKPANPHQALLADLVNNRLNAYITAPNGDIHGALRGGIEIVAKQGQQLQAGQTLAMVYGEQAPTADLCEQILALFEFSETIA